MPAPDHLAAAKVLRQMWLRHPRMATPSTKRVAYKVLDHHKDKIEHLLLVSDFIRIQEAWAKHFPKTPYPTKTEEPDGSTPRGS